MVINHKILSLLFLFSSLQHLTGKIISDNEYAVDKIPKRLLNNTDAVIRKYDLKFEVYDINSAVMYIKKAVTIFSKKEQHNGQLTIWYDRFRNIADLDGYIYNAEGEEIRELEDRDIKDYSDFEGYNLYSDNRVKYIEMYYDNFPYTVEYIYEIEYDGYLGWPSWYSRYSANPVESTTFEVLLPADSELRYWCNNDKLKPDISENSRKKIYKWTVQNQLPLPKEVAEEDIEDFASIVHIAPDDFEIEGYKGNMNTWKNFGEWYYKLYSERNTLPDEAVNEIIRKTEPLSGTREKVEALYSYLQSKTRYVSVQLGIGGWQPFDASYVYKNGYGDCKALSNFMITILKHAGITSYPVLINNGFHRIPLIPEFPSHQFNHVIVCVPGKKDSVWLECTSQVLPPGNIGWSNENRAALMITPEGGVIVKTPLSNSKKNYQLKKAEVTLSLNGDASANTEIEWTGNQHGYVVDVAVKSSHIEQEKWIRSLLDVPDLKLNKYSFNKENKLLSKVSLSFDLTLLRYASVSANRIFFNPNLMERRKTIPSEILLRTSPVRLRYPYLDVDSIAYILPVNFKPEAIPAEVDFNAPFGSFNSKTILTDENKLLYVRRLEINEYIIPAEGYYEYRDFISEVVKADFQKVVLIKK